MTQAQATANGRAAVRPLFCSRSGAVETRVRRARRRRRGAIAEVPGNCEARASASR